MARLMDDKYPDVFSEFTGLTWDWRQVVGGFEMLGWGNGKTVGSFVGEMGSDSCILKGFYRGFPLKSNLIADI